MKVLGKPISEDILFNLKEEIIQNSLQPQLAVISAGNNPASKIYIKYKKMAAEKAGITLTVHEFTENENIETKNRIEELNNDTSVHGIIVQLPVYNHWNADELVYAVAPSKDVDGFLPNSVYTAATAAGVWEMITEFARIEHYESAVQFLQNKNIVVLGKGRTAGKPTRELLSKNGVNSTLIDSKTENPQDLISKADIVISATGIKHIINGDNIKPDCFIISVGVGKEVVDGNEKIFGDVDEETIKNTAKLYCPTIGGIGPLTIACLLRNVVESAKRRQQ